LHLMIPVQKITQKYFNQFQSLTWRWPSQNTFGMWTVLYWTRSSRTQFGVSINVCRLAGDTLNITSNFLYCNHQVYTDVLITLYKETKWESYYRTEKLNTRGVTVLSFAPVCCWFCYQCLCNTDRPWRAALLSVQMTWLSVL
jgi:hypothetical protein